MIPPLKIPLLAVLLLTVTGCGFAELAYDHAPAYVAEEFDEAFDLDDQQSLALNARLQEYFAWHRDRELDRYHELLERAALVSADGIRAEEFLRLNREVRNAWQRALEKVIDSVGELAVTLTPEQIESYREYHAERSREYRDYFEKSEQQREIYRVARHLERLEKWFGDFDFSLEGRVEERLRRLPDIYAPWVRYREARHRALVATLREAPRNGIDKARLKTIMLDPNTEYARVYEPLRRAYWREYAAALEDISNWVGKQQRQRVVSRLQDYARIIEGLGRG